MPQLDQTHVLVERAIVVWDAVTQPEVRDDGSKSYQLKVVIPANSPDVQLVEQLASQCLQESKWKGVMPNGGNFAINNVNAGEFNDMFPGGHVINPSTNRTPSVYDENGNQMDPMQYGAQLYSGQVVSVIVHCWDYDNKSKGVKCGLDGIKIHASANAQRQQFGGGGFDAAAAFGAQGNGGNSQQNNGQNNGGQNNGNPNNGQQSNGQQYGSQNNGQNSGNQNNGQNNGGQNNGNQNNGQQSNGQNNGSQNNGQNNGGQNNGNQNNGQQSNGQQYGNQNNGQNSGNQNNGQNNGQQSNGQQYGNQNNGGQPMQQANDFLPQR